MKRLLFPLLLLATGSLSFAQEQIRVFKNGNSTRFTAPEVVFANNGTAFTVGDSTYVSAEIDSITVVHTVSVTFNGNTASVDLGHARGVTYTTNGAHVNIVSTNAKSELEFVLQGESTQGSLTYTGPLKCKFYLNGLNLKSNSGAALDIQCGKRVDLILNEGTTNVLEDAAGGTQKAALYCRGHLEVSGSGSLTVRGNTKHAISTKEYMEMKKSTGSITVTKAVSDGLHIGQYFKMNGGTLTVSGQGGEGVQVEFETLSDDVTPDPEKEDNGLMFINGGTINITASSPATKAIKAPSNLTVTGGTVLIAASGPGTKGISVSGNMLVNQESDVTLIQVRANGGLWEDENEDDVWCTGIKIKGNLTVQAGTIRVSNNASGTRGIRLGGVLTQGPEAVVSASISYSGDDNDD